MKNVNVLSVILSDYALEALEALLMRLRVSPDVLVEQMIITASLFAFPDRSRECIHGTECKFWESKRKDDE